MKDSVKIGMNRTGLQMSPVLSNEMAEGIAEFTMPSSRSEISPADLRQDYIRESGQLGTVPMPGTLKGMATTSLEILKGKKPEVLIDKLGERLAFERTGTRMYDALITKCEAASPKISLEMIRQFQAEELQHFTLVKETMEMIGADPTAQTPCADVAGVTAQGILQVLNDPRTTVAQCVQAILIGELADNDGWALLIRLAQDAGMDEVANKFLIAKEEEDRHLLHIRAWLEELVRRDESVPVQ